MILSNKQLTKALIRLHVYGADQTVRMCRLICTFVVRKPRNTGFFASRPRLCTVNFPIIKIQEHSKQVINVLLKNTVTLP